MSERLTVVLPIYNEEDAIEKTIEEISILFPAHLIKVILFTFPPNLFPHIISKLSFSNLCNMEGKYLGL